MQITNPVLPYMYKRPLRPEPAIKNPQIPPAAPLRQFSAEARPAMNRPGYEASGYLYPIQEIKPNPLPLSQQLKEIIKSDNANQLTVLLQNGLDPNIVISEGETILQQAVRDLKPRIVDVLMRAGADVHRPYPKPQIIDFAGETVKIARCTPLMMTFEFRTDIDNLSLFKLIRIAFSGGNLNTQTRQSIAARSRIMQSLLLAHADPNALDPDTGITPLMMASRLAEPSLLKQLMDGGAKPNVSFYRDKTPLQLMRYVISPAVLVANHTRQGSDCLAILFQQGEDLVWLRKHSPIFGEVLKTLAIRHPDTANQILQQVFQHDNVAMNRNMVNAIIDKFLAAPGAEQDNILHPAVEALLTPQIDLDLSANDLQHYSHLKAWVGEEVTASQQGVNRQLMEGWEPDIFIARKIKSLLYSLKTIARAPWITDATFGEPKAAVLHKIREEIYHQVTSFFTYQHQMMLSDNYSSTHMDLAAQQAHQICDEINALRPGQSFALFSGFPQHAAYMEFRRQPDNNLTRILYNLGPGNEKHLVATEGLAFYPHAIENIPSFLFETHSREAIEYLTLPTRCSDFQTDFDYFWNRMYDDPLKMGGDFPKDVSTYIPLPPQSAGNCTVENNQAAIINRLRNPALFHYLRTQEIALAKTRISIPRTMEARKELEAEASKLDSIARYKPDSLLSGEQDIFEFLKDKTRLPFPSMYQPVLQKPGDRIAEQLAHLKNPKALAVYLQHGQVSEYLFKIADYYHSDKLKRLIVSHSIQLV